MDQKNPKSLFPSSSAITYWQVEMQEGPIAGKKNQRVYCLGLKDYIAGIVENCYTSYLQLWNKYMAGRQVPIFSYFFLFFSAYSYFSYFLAISSYFSYFLAILLQ